MIDDTNSEHDESGPCKLFIDEIKSMTRDLIWCINNFKCTSGFSQTFSRPTSRVQLNTWQSEWLDVQRTTSEAFCERPQKIFVLFDLWINEFFENGPPTVCPTDHPQCVPRTTHSVTRTFVHPNTIVPCLIYRWLHNIYTTHQLCLFYQRNIEKKYVERKWENN